MKTILKIAVLSTALILMLIADIPLLSGPLVPEAEAIFGVRRRAWRRGVIVGSTVGAASEAAAMSQPQAAPAQQHNAPAVSHAPTPAAAGKRLPLGTVVSALPAGCTATPVGGEQYYYCGGNFYRAVFQGNNLVYVTAQPK
jgi:hypothetical protein